MHTSERCQVKGRMRQTYTAYLTGRGRSWLLGAHWGVPLGAILGHPRPFGGCPVALVGLSEAVFGGSWVVL
eukprot:532440-Pyramimonas_sp.AAC.1